MKNIEKMIHVFEQGSNNRTLLLLHGTGGDEYDLIPLAKMIDSQANILSVRGNVSENGMNRFFKRIREGIFDEEDLMKRTHELAEFITTASQKYNLDLDKFIVFGYSNGANIAANILYTIPGLLKYAVLSHPMVPRRNATLPNLSDVKVFISAGENDPIVPPHEIKELGQVLTDNNANVSCLWTQNGHRLSREELSSIIKWYNALNI